MAVDKHRHRKITAADFAISMLFALDPWLETTILLIQVSCCVFSLLVLSVLYRLFY